MVGPLIWILPYRSAYLSGYRKSTVLWSRQPVSAALCDPRGPQGIAPRLKSVDPDDVAVDLLDARPARPWLLNGSDMEFGRISPSRRTVQSDLQAAAAVTIGGCLSRNQTGGGRAEDGDEKQFGSNHDASSNVVCLNDSPLL